MRLWRKARRVLFKAAQVGPRKRTTHERVSSALLKIKATEKEAGAIIKFAKMAEKRGEARETYRAKGNLSNDAFNLELMRKTEEVLGKKRATRFFDMCNDPYF